MNCDSHRSWRAIYRLPILALIWLFNGEPQRCKNCKTVLFGEWPT